MAAAAASGAEASACIAVADSSEPQLRAGPHALDKGLQRTSVYFQVVPRGRCSFVHLFLMMGLEDSAGRAQTSAQCVASSLQRHHSKPASFQIMSDER